MSVKYRRAREGYKYTLTLFGAKFDKVRSKYNILHKLYTQYQHYAPLSWFEKGYIVEVKENGEKES